MLNHLWHGDRRSTELVYDGLPRSFQLATLLLSFDCSGSCEMSAGPGSPRVWSLMLRNSRCPNLSFFGEFVFDETW